MTEHNRWSMKHEKNEKKCKKLYNGGKWAASFCHQGAALVPDFFRNFYLVKNHKIANNSTGIKAREKYMHIFGIITALENFWCMFD
jgi:hypothetical protein